MYADPMLLGRYPDGFADVMPLQDGDLEAIAQPLDFYGFNYYNPSGSRRPPEGAELPFVQEDIPGRTRRPTSAGRSCPRGCAR